MTKPRSSRQTGLLLAMVTAVVSGVAVFANGYGVRVWSEVADPTTYTTLKNLTAAAVIVVVGFGLMARRSERRPRIPDSAPDRWKLGAIAVVGGSVPFVLFFEGLAIASSAQAAFLHKTLIIWVAVLAVLFLKERLGWPHVAAIGLLVWGQMNLVGEVTTISFGLGEVMILGATVLWSVEIVVAKKVLSDVAPLTVATARMAVGAVVLIGWGLLRAPDISWAAVGPHHWLWIGVTGALLAGYVGLWFGALSRAPAVDVTAVLVFGAVVTALLQSTVKGIQFPNPVGIVLITAAVALATTVSWRVGRESGHDLRA